MLSQTETKNPLVSVIVPTFNRPAMLREALTSIAAQTYAPIEIIVVNDGGVDVEGIVSQVTSKQRIVYLEHPTNKGLPAARNTGLKAASGDYIAYLDDDDVYYPNHVQTLVSFLCGSNYKVAYTDAYQADQLKLSTFWRNVFTIHEEPSRKTNFLFSCTRIAPRQCLRFVYRTFISRPPYSNLPFKELRHSGVDIFTRAGGAYFIVQRTIQFSRDFDREMILVSNFIPVLCVMHDRTCLERTGLFDETLTTQEDWDLWIRMSREHSFVHIKKTTCEYTRRNDGSNITTSMGADFKRTNELIHERYRQLRQVRNSLRLGEPFCSS